MKYVRLEDLCTNIIDCPHSTPKWLDAGIPVIRNYNIKNGHLDLSKPSYVDEETYNSRVSRAKPQAGDIIISREAPIGDACIIPDNFRCCLGQRLVLLKVDRDKCSPEYLLFALLSDYVQTQMKRVDKTGSIVSNLNIPDLKALNIPVVDDYIEVGKVLNIINRKIDINNSINIELENMADSFYGYWFLQFDFPNEEGQPYQSSGGDMIWSEELKREIPKGWNEGTLEDFIEIGNGKDHQSLMDGDIPVYGSGGVMRYVEKALYSGESVLIPRKGTLNNIMYVNEDFWTVDTMFYSKMRKEHCALYVFHTARIYDFERKNTGTGVPSMTSIIIYGQKVVVPPDDILEKFDRLLQPLYQLMKQVEKENQKLSSLREFFLPMLINGQVKYMR